VCSWSVLAYPLCFLPDAKLPVLVSLLFVHSCRIVVCCYPKTYLKACDVLSVCCAPASILVLFAVAMPSAVPADRCSFVDEAHVCSTVVYTSKLSLVASLQRRFADIRHPSPMCVTRVRHSVCSTRPMCGLHTSASGDWRQLCRSATIFD
jgi:hypothetical protein